ncbi:uncharacterized protein BCR38DRAFT_415976 [Pseudomassariella vexata]|uniref:Uncharacterized protein n=1 Tax=Pseudomassariella vexata TaxID=1141098 RepID=A0A1Y2EHT6_9PEZI|nr:uncharacterized protein BCR38DRAFT_415976 [Pseudomassariella vexata]ORY71123.1 hypothetical protein BCR38DRAFT_415976 [Pseudomassariella vexata]
MCSRPGAGLSFAGFEVFSRVFAGSLGVVKMDETFLFKFTQGASVLRYCCNHDWRLHPACPFANTNQRLLQMHE